MTQASRVDGIRQNSTCDGLDAESSCLLTGVIFMCDGEHGDALAPFDAEMLPFEPQFCLVGQMSVVVLRIHLYCPSPLVRKPGVIVLPAESLAQSATSATMAAWSLGPLCFPIGGFPQSYFTLSTRSIILRVANNWSIRKLFPRLFRHVNSRRLGFRCRQTSLQPEACRSWSHCPSASLK